MKDGCWINPKEKNEAIQNIIRLAISPDRSNQKLAKAICSQIPIRASELYRTMDDKITLQYDYYRRGRGAAKSIQMFVTMPSISAHGTIYRLQKDEGGLSQMMLDPRFRQPKLIIPDQHSILYGYFFSNKRTSHDSNEFFVCASVRELFAEICTFYGETLRDIQKNQKPSKT